MTDVPKSLGVGRGGGRESGYLYVLEFYNRTIKVGRTLSPVRRMMDYELQAAVHENPIVNKYISEILPGVGDAEDDLIKQVNEWCHPIAREWFSAVRYGNRKHATPCASVSRSTSIWAKCARAADAIAERHRQFG